MPQRYLWKELNERSEADLRLNILLPILEKTPGVEGISDVHGKNEAGLDIIFFTRDAVRRTCYGLQLKKGAIGGGGRSKGSVEDVITQLKLATNLKHPVAVGGAGTYRIDHFIVATSGNITEGARREIAERLERLPVDFWDGHEIMRRIREFFPELLTGVDAATVAYLQKLVETYDRLDTLDQIQPVHKRTLTDIFEEPNLRRRFDPGVPGAKGGTLSPTAAFPALSVLQHATRAVLVADQNDGKTSTLRMLALKRARLLLTGEVPEQLTAGDAIPVLVRAREIARHGSVVDAVRAELARLDATALAAEAADLLASGLMLLIVDGFSELQAESDKETCENLLTGAAAQFAGAPVVLAARPADFLTPKFFPQFRHFTIEAFTDQQALALAGKWTRGLGGKEEVVARMVGRVREALQLPGSPIPAIIGVMVYQEEQRFVTNTAEAVDAYMVIRLGRYAREMGIKQEVEWSRKQDLLAEVAFGMVERGDEALPAPDVVREFDAIFGRLGETARGAVAVQELVESGVLVDWPDGLRFHRTAFRDFFAAQHLFRRRSADFDRFFTEKLWDKRWGQVLVFAAGLRRHNTDLLAVLNAQVQARRAAELPGPSAPAEGSDGATGRAAPAEERFVSDEYLYGSYLLGRLLSNSEASDAEARLSVLRTCLDASTASLPEFVAAAKAELGNIGEIAALVAVEQSFLVTVGVPWLALQFQQLASDARLSDEERLLAASVHANLGADRRVDVLRQLFAQARSMRVLLVLRALTVQLLQERTITPEERAAIESLQFDADRKLGRYRGELQRLLKFKNKILELEAKRLLRINGAHGR